MKRFYSTLAMMVMLAATVVAQTSFKKTFDNFNTRGKKASAVLAKGKTVSSTQAQAKGPKRATTAQRSLTACYGEYNFTTGFYTENGDSTMVAVGFSTTELSSYVGGEITTIHLPVNDTDNTLRVYGWVALDDLSNVVSQGQLASLEEGWVDVTLPQSVTIDGEHKVYIGASYVTNPDAEVALCICMNSGVNEKDEGCLLGCTFSDNPTYWEDYGYTTWEDYSNLGYGNAAVEAIVDGVTVLDKDVLISSASLSYSDIRTVTDQAAIFTLMNNGKSEIHTFNLEVYVNDKLTTTRSFACNLGLNETFSNTFFFKPGLTETTTDAEVTLKAVNINGEGDDDDMSNNSAKAGTFNAYTDMFNRNVVVEEGTGTWCGYCVYGIWGMETMREDHPDDFIGLAIHASDEMDCGYDDYNYYLWQYAGYDGFPSCNIDRTYTDYPDPETLELYYQMEKDMWAPAKIEGAKAYWDGDQLNVEGRALFAYDSPKSKVYAICTVLVEDSVGPYDQTNYTSGSGENAGGWEDKDYYVSTLYNDVVRGMYPDFYGSLMEDVYMQGFKAFEPVEFKYSFDIDNVVNDYEYDANGNTTPITRDRYQNKDNLRVVLMLCEQNKVGAVLNAVKCNIYPDEASAVEGIEDNTQAPSQYYSIEGIRLSNPTKGLVIEKQNGKTTKHYVK